MKTNNTPLFDDPLCFPFRLSEWGSYVGMWAPFNSRGTRPLGEAITFLWEELRDFIKERGLDEDVPVEWIVHDNMPQGPTVDWKEGPTVAWKINIEQRKKNQKTEDTGMENKMETKGGASTVVIDDRTSHITICGGAGEQVKSIVTALRGLADALATLTE